MAFYVYILASQKNGTRYTGHTDDLEQRIFDHREGRGCVFTRQYGITRLVWTEEHDTRESAKWREYRIKAWKRAWKTRLIEEMNPNWEDLFLRINQ
ncbi:MAG: GIY-YIG nuclease family protein [Pseudomonadota bacterium]